MNTGFWWGHLRKKDHLEDPDMDDRIILKWIFRIQDGISRLDCYGSEQGQVAGV
jgi:hypothetical protein